MLGKGKPIGLPRGLPRLRKLAISQCGVVDIASIATAYPALAELTVAGDTNQLLAAERLADLTGLERLTLHACYSLDAASLPSAASFPGLWLVDIDGHRRQDAAVLRERFGGVPRFELRGARAKRG